MDEDDFEDLGRDYQTMLKQAETGLSTPNLWLMTAIMMMMNTILFWQEN